jgi:hypothetical protein
MIEHNDLIERLEKATGPDNELDRDICLVYGPYRNDIWEKQPVHPRILQTIDFKVNDWVSTPRYTASIDAALTLVPEGWAWFVQQIDDFTNGDARIWLPHTRTRGLKQEDFVVRNAASPATALCIAALKAQAVIKIS